jgi:hypothetical protein
MTVSNSAGALHLCNEQLTIARGWWSRTLFVGTDDMKEAIITLVRRIPRMDVALAAHEILHEAGLED